MPTGENAGDYAQLNEGEWLDYYESLAGAEPTAETELAIKSAQWLVAARLELQDPSADKLFLRLHRGLETSARYQRALAARLDNLAQFPEEMRQDVLLEQFSTIRDLLDK